MTFDGWPASMLEFYAELEVNNTKAFWTANTALYETDVLAPMEAVTELLAPEFGEPKIFRPHRDLRFSKDKTPYKTQISATFGWHDNTSAFYLAAGADGLLAGGGCYGLAKDQLERYRHAVDAAATGDELAALIADLEARGFDVTSTNTLKTAPRGWAKDHPRIELLRRKDLTFMQVLEDDPRVHTAEAAEWIAETFRAGAPLVGWLAANVGPTTEERGRR